jgi:carbon-monoxide dehydrogenase iron sulfur subunit
MITRVLTTDPAKCTGCGLCRIICSMVKDGMRYPSRSRIRVLRHAYEGYHLPVICQHCQDAPCMAVCPREAIYRDDSLERVMVDYDLCISCKMCVAACPFGAMGFDEDRHMVFKCDLCGGDPQCVRFCFPRALAFIADYRQQYPAVREAAGRVGRKLET